MNVLYVRISTEDQKTDRQLVGAEAYGWVVEDRCSGAIPLFERNGGKEVKQLVDRGLVRCLSVWQIDRLGRDLRDILNTIHYFNERRVPIHFVCQGLRTLDENGEENPIAKLIISVLGIVAEMQRKQIRENQLQGVRLAKIRGVYKGRKKGTKENTLQFLGKEKNKKALQYLQKGYKGVEIAKILGININTITKIKKLGLNP